MVDLVGARFRDHLQRIHREFAVQRAVYDLPLAKWYVPDPNGPDLSVRFHEQSAGTPVGPAAGPHGQMAQNLALSYLAGGRIIELKTVQVKDDLRIPRPCIDAANVGYNVEWSQELRLAESLHEYVAGAMLVHVLRHGDFIPGRPLAGPAGDVIFDMSVGYDLAGIQSPPVRAFITGMLEAGDMVERLRAEIPTEYKHLRDLDYPTRLSRSITLSTFHGCPAGEIERICEHLITEYGVNVIVKMNPPMLGQERLERLLHDVMGYDEIRVHQPAYASGLMFAESVAMVRRLDDLAQKHHVRCGAKFSNTLEVVNHRNVFSADNTVMYMSGPPLYPITLALTALFREAVGPDIPISFSAGIDQKNCADVVACGIKPVTTCTDLLRPGGYGRLPKYLQRLAEDMRRAGAATVDAYILARGAAATGEAIADPMVAGWKTTSILAARAAEDPRYHAAQNSAVPKRINSRLVIFDCVTCDKCIPVCPNDANFTYPLAEQDFAYRDWAVAPDGSLTPVGAPKRFAIARSMQIANFSDYCNECGNCDTFCPEYGGPFIEKPTFFSSRREFERHAPRDGATGHDGFCVEQSPDRTIILGRIRGCGYRFTRFPDGSGVFADAVVEITVDANHQPQSATWLPAAENAAPSGRTQPTGPVHPVDMHACHTLRLLLIGILDRSRMNPVNATLDP